MRQRKVSTLREQAQKARRLEVMEKQGVVIPKEDEEPDDSNIDYSGSDGTEPSLPETSGDNKWDDEDWDETE